MMDLAYAAIRIAHEVNRLWPDETIAERGANLAEEAGEVNRAITKRRHASKNRSGLCKGLTVNQWTQELQVECAQVLGVVLDIMHREGFPIEDSLRECVGRLIEREPDA